MEPEAVANRHGLGPQIRPTLERRTLAFPRFGTSSPRLPPLKRPTSAENDDHQRQCIFCFSVPLLVSPQRRGRGRRRRRSIRDGHYDDCAAQSITLLGPYMEANKRNNRYYN